MPGSSTTFINNPKLVFIVSLLVAAFWLAGNYINIYNSKIAGALFEILWLPMIAMLFILPVLSGINWLRQKFTCRSLYPWSILVIALSVVLVIYK